MSSHLFIYQQQCFFRLCSVSSMTFFFSRLSVVNSNFNPKKSLQTLVITFTVRWWTPRSSSQHHTENMSSKFRPKKQFLNTRTGSFTPSLGPNFLPLFFQFPISPFLTASQLHCLPSSSCAAKPESHPSGDGVRPHLPASEFVCVDELWTQSAGMFCCGDYKSCTVTGTQLSHTFSFVSGRLSGGDSSHSKHFTPPNTRPQGSKPACHCGPVKPKGPDANTRDSEVSWEMIFFFLLHGVTIFIWKMNQDFFSYFFIYRNVQSYKF